MSIDWQAGDSFCRVEFDAVIDTETIDPAFWHATIDGVDVGIAGVNPDTATIVNVDLGVVPVTLTLLSFLDEAAIQFPDGRPLLAPSAYDVPFP